MDEEQEKTRPLWEAQEEVNEDKHDEKREQD
jgi:hypothetical protein